MKARLNLFRLPHGEGLDLPAYATRHAAGMDVREVEQLIDVETEEETIAVIKAMSQLYRENARYLDRIYKWMNKVGLEWIRERIADPDERAALVARFDLSQTVYQKDPLSPARCTTG